MTQKHEKGLMALLESKSLAEAAVIAGVTVRTLQNWQAQPEFQRAYRAARRQLVESAIVRLQSVSDQAVEALTRQLNSSLPQVQVASARIILGFAVASVGTIEIEDRLDQLEGALQAAIQPPSKRNGHADD
ncbi:MAG: hypothetical protein M3X11_18235 [Acidobacteriota bacterium]|nr:hypothetical protein [Acidobacteriota bacterium]